MRKFFNSRETQAKQLVKNCLHQRHYRRSQREKVLRELKPEINRISAISKLAEALSTKVIT